MISAREVFQKDRDLLIKFFLTNTCEIYKICLLKREDVPNTQSWNYNQSLAGIRSTAWRKTGSTFIYTLLVRSEEECSNSF